MTPWLVGLFGRSPSVTTPRALSWRRSKHPPPPRRIQDSSFFFVRKYALSLYLWYVFNFTFPCRTAAHSIKRAAAFSPSEAYFHSFSGEMLLTAGGAPNQNFQPPPPPPAPGTLFLLKIPLNSVNSSFVHQYGLSYSSRSSERSLFPRIICSGHLFE